MNIKKGDWLILKDKKIMFHHKNLRNILKEIKKYNRNEITIAKEPYNEQYYKPYEEK